MFDYLTHYYQELPFHSISDLSDRQRSAVLAKLSSTRELPFRLTCSDYFSRRRSIESRIRDLFIERGGKPVRRNPLYMVLGDSPYWERVSQNRLKLPLSFFDSDAISFTFSDSFYTFAKTTLRGIPIPHAPHRTRVFVMDELSQVIEEFGLPSGYSDPDEPFDVYIEAQIWDDAPLVEYTALSGD